jgi:branched-subunit amino acid aminotransferase/4-amino-4-deoxychorismate lyase
LALYFIIKTMSNEVGLYQDGVKADAEVFRGDHLGLGIFESFRLRRTAGSIFCPEFMLHILRFVKSVGELSLPPVSPEEIIRVIARYLDETAFARGDVWVRLKRLPTVWEVEFGSYTPAFSLRDGVKVVTLEAERPFPQWKHFSSIVSVMARKVASANGADEALLIDRDGGVREGAWSSFFMVDSNGNALTPSSRVLQGVTRNLLINRCPEATFLCEDFSISQLHERVAEAFLTHSSHGVVPIVAIDGDPVGDGTPGAITRSIQRWYEEFATSEESRWPGIAGLQESHSAMGRAA